MATSVKHVSSKLLEKGESDQLFGKMTPNSVSLATGVAQLLVTEPPTHDQWQKKCTGVTCFTRDGNRRSYFIQMYDPEDFSLVWEQELYNDFSYTMPKPLFIAFEAENCMAALNFANKEEASAFEETLKIKLDRTHHYPKDSTSRDEKESSQKSISSKWFRKGKKKKNTKKPALTAHDISSPVDFRHVAHVGYDPNNGFDTSKCGESWNKLFTSLNVTENMLTNPETSKFIYEFVEENGGIETMVGELDKMKKKDKPIPTLDSHPTSKQPVGKTSPSVPPPVPTRSKFSVSNSHSSDKISSVSTSRPPPPSLPPRPIISNGSSAVASPLSEVTETSHKGGDFLQQIRSGIQLKVATSQTESNASENEPDDEGIVGLLALRLQEMRKNVFEDEEYSSGDDSEEWCQ